MQRKVFFERRQIVDRGLAGSVAVRRAKGDLISCSALRERVGVFVDGYAKNSSAKLARVRFHVCPATAESEPQRRSPAQDRH
ncbi:Uncharacterised protein [Mycobacterium tuberculosis]|uniref:Uncharacterized protein n=1 Tax=Mycobacterium tuberculosis TaxID=1773 RepID=A0A0U0QP74_MYCTX|nr:Uncharacterised protein [Mycobacterium tuberculosis]